MFHGSMVALVTPMDERGNIDYDGLTRLINFQIDSGTKALIVLGTTGECSTLTMDERKKITQHALEEANNRVPIIIGTSANGTQKAIELTELAQHEGAAAALIMTPAYIKPTQEGLFQHYKAISESVPIPQILYNVPGRTMCDLLPETVERLSNFTNIVGIKEATGDLSRVEDIIKRCGDRIDIYSGDDKTAMDLMLLGGKGNISVTANVNPNALSELSLAALSNDKKKATDINSQLMPLHDQLFMETNPIPVKWALHEMGLIGPGIRLPMTPLSEKYRGPLRETLKIAGVL